MLTVGRMLEGSFRYPLAREGVTAPGGHAYLPNARQKFRYIVGQAALRLAFLMIYQKNKTTYVSSSDFKIHFRQISPKLTFFYDEQLKS